MLADSELKRLLLFWVGRPFRHITNREDDGRLSSTANLWR